MSRSNGAHSVYAAQWVLPITAPVIAQGAVVVEGERIVFVGPRAELPSRFASERCIDLGNAVLMPGLVNAHTHLELTALRGFLEGLAFPDWLALLTQARRECFDADSLMDSSCAGIAEGLRNGITTYADTTESGVPLHAMHAMGVRGVGYLEVFGPDATQREAALAALLVRAGELRARDTALVRTGLSPHAPYTVSAALYRAVAEVARVDQWPLAVHIAEGVAEMQLVRDGAGPFADRLRARGIAVSPQARSPIALLEACGVLDCRPLLIHAIQVDADDIATIAGHGATVVHCPVSNLKLGHGIAPVLDICSAGVALGLGTDSVASNDRMDLLGEARLAALLAATRAGVPDALSAHDVLALATLGGARALGLSDTIGSLEVGKSADLAAFALTDVDAHPVHDPVVTLIHVLAGAVRAELVVVAGVVRVRGGELITGDPAREQRMAVLGERLRAWRSLRNLC